MGSGALTNNELVSYSDDAEGKRIAEQDLTLRVSSGGRGHQAHQEAKSALADILCRDTDSRVASARDVTDTSETMVETLCYDSFGDLLNDQDAAADSAFKFKPYDCDPNSSLDGSCTRAYAPTPGRWLQEEPVGFGAGEANLASYVGNDPAESSE